MQTVALQGRTIGMTLSGGLSSLSVASWLARNGHRVIGLAGYLGQCSRAEFESFVETVQGAGIEVHTVDLSEAMAEAALDVVAYNASYDGGYWNTTSLSREVIVAGVVPLFHLVGADVLAHGCVGGGNDQRRFERNGARYLPGVPILAPWTEAEVRAAIPDRHAMAAHLEPLGLRCMPGNTAEHSIDGNLAGFSHEDASLEDLSHTPAALARCLGVAPQDGPDSVRSVVVGIERGRPTMLDGKRLSPAALLEQANAIAGEHGLGLFDVLENRVNGTKCRGVYEAPGMQLLSAAVEAAYETVTDRAADELRRTLSRQVSVSVYEATTTSPAARAARAGLEELAAHATATVSLDIFKGSVIGRAIHSFDEGAGITHQRRFAGNGHNWASAALSVHPNSPVSKGN